MELDLKNVEFSRSDLSKGLQVPKSLDEKLAEEIGIFLGDGYLSAHGYHSELGFSEHLTDDYFYLLNYVKSLMKHLLNHPGTVMALKEDNALRVMYWSKAVFSFHSGALGLPIREKKFVLKIPDPVLGPQKMCRRVASAGLSISMVL